MEVKNSDGLHYYMIAPEQEFPKALREKSELMYYESYDPKLHAHLSNKEMGLDDKWRDYEEFIADMFHTDFGSYQTKKQTRILFFITQGAKTEDYDNIIGIAALLPQEEGHYYIDHIGVHKDFQKQGIGSSFFPVIQSCIPDLRRLSLDTRTFNISGKETYRKNKFVEVEFPEGHRKKGYYLYYERWYES